jgi:DNA (cytosine-5)-methyltransferase 1
MNELVLFAGAGGGILGGHLLGWRTVAAVEIEDYPRRVLLQRQADGILPRFPIWDDVCTFDGKPWKGKVDVISGGFPCQDISTAGKGAGLDGAKSGLWFEMRRIIGEVRPRFVLVENSPALTIRGGERVIADLTALGYDARWGVIGAAEVGALHRRERIWIVANANGSGLEKLDLTAEPKIPGLDTGKTSTGFKTNSKPEGIGLQRINESRSGSKGDSQRIFSESTRVFRSEAESDLADTDNAIGGGELWGKRSGEVSQKEGHSCSVFDQPEPLRMVNGVANRVDRLKAAGNGQVPAVVRRAWGELNGN